MIVGFPVDAVAPRDPHSAFSHVHGYPVSGGLVDGPVYSTIFGNLRGLRLTKPDSFEKFQSDLAVYHDDWGDYSTNEPTLDGTASLVFALAAKEDQGQAGQVSGVMRRGALVRMDTTRKVVYLVFTGHEFGEGGEVVRATLRRHGAPASFFFTGDFYRNPAFYRLIRGLVSDGHYLGPHSDKHLLYAFWENPDSLLVDRSTFERDLLDNYAAMSTFGVRPGTARAFVPPFEWTNDLTSAWARAMGVLSFTFTPGTRTNADYTVPGMGDRYVTSERILRNVLRVEKSSPSGLNGHILLMHIGVDPQRPDPLYRRLDELLTLLRDRGYSFSKLPG
jgi:peptidoglycan/xylan/chitin deacetylase (PgdA/CDA1 family)